MVKFKYDEVELPEGKVESDFANVDIRSAALKEALQRFQIARLIKVVPSAIKGDTVRTLADGRQIKLHDFSQLFLLTFPQTFPLDSVLTVLQKVEGIVYAEPDQINISDIEPDDQFFKNGDQWHLKQEPSDEDIDAPEAWDLSKGDGIKIAIIDQGVRRTHQDLASKIEGGETGVDPGNPNHGTRVAGVAAAATDNSVGVAGVGWNSKIIPYNDNRQLSQSIADINAAVSAGADIINMSWHNTSYSQSLKDALDNAFAQGVTLVAAAGNDVESSFPYVAYPSAFDGLVMAVSGTNISGTFSSISNYGFFVDVAAPGQAIKTTDGDNDADYAAPTGTSFSAPIVSGIVALLKAFEPTLIDRDFERIIELSAEDKGDPGWDEKFGYGRVNAFEALRHVSPPYTIIRGNATLTKTNNDIQVTFLVAPLPEFAAGVYVVDRWQLEAVVSFSYSEIPWAWLSQVGYSAANPMMPLFSRMKILRIPPPRSEPSFTI